MPESRILATDLDGTLIPLGQSGENCRDLRILSRELMEQEVTVVFVTGRHLDSITRAIDLHPLPLPHWIICDVGTTICRFHPDGRVEQVADYQQHLDEKIVSLPIVELRERLMTLSELRLQEPEKQGRFKLSYFCDGSQLDRLQSQIADLLQQWDAPYSVVGSIDPYNGDGLIDLLPAGVHKAYALSWWADHAALPHDDIIFAGDSGNDLAAFLAGYRVIVVSNAAADLAQHVRSEHARRNYTDRLFIASQPATSGVLEGCRWFGLLGRS